MALLEKIEFLLKYRFYNYANIEKAEQFMKTLHDLFTETKKLIENNKEIMKPKNILKILIKEKYTSDMIDTPNDILMQRLIYYKGCLAFKCCHYMDAIKHFKLIFQENMTKISDGKIVVKALKKMIKIANIFKKGLYYSKKIKEERLLNEYIISKIKETKKFISMDRDFIILISSNSSVDFLKQSLDHTRYIIDNYIKDNDRFCLAFASSEKSNIGGLKMISTLTNKNGCQWKKDLIQNIKLDQEFLSNSLEDGEDNLEYILKCAKSYISNKNINNRNVFYIFIGNKDRMNHESIDLICSQKLKKLISSSKEKLLLILQGSFVENENNENAESDLSLVEEKSFDIQKIDKTICNCIQFDEISKLKEEVTMYGKINFLDDYSNEKYDYKK